MKERVPGCLRNVEDEIMPSFMGNLILYDIRIPIKQPGFNGKYPSFFFVVSNVVCYVHPEHWGR